MAFALTYQDYVSSHPGDATGGSEGGQGTSSLMSQDAWDHLSDDAKWNEVGNGIILTPADARYDDLAKELGVTNGRQIVGGPTDKSIPLDTTNFVDPNKVAKQGNLFFTSDENLTPKAQQQGGVADWFWPVGFILGAVGGAALANAGILSGTAVTGAEATAAGGFTTGADIAGAAGAQGAAGSTVGAAAAPGAEVGPPASLAPEPAAPVGPPGADVGPPGSLAPEPGVTPPPGADVGPPSNLAPSPGEPAPVTDVSTPAPSGNPAPVTDVSTPGPAPVTDLSTPGGNGLINSASNGWDSMTNWYSHLSPASRMILGTAVSTGARGAITAVSQHEAEQAARDAEERHRQDVIRQHQVPVLPPGTFTYKPPGG